MTDCPCHYSIAEALMSLELSPDGGSLKAFTKTSDYDITLAADGAPSVSQATAHDEQ